MIEQVTDSSSIKTLTNTSPVKKMTDSIIELSNTRVADNQLNGADPVIFYTSLEKLQESLQCVSKHLDNVQKTNKEFYDFDKQVIKMNAIKDALESLANALKTALMHKKSLSSTAQKDLSKKITKLLNSLTKEHQNLIKKYKDKNAIFLKNFDIWLEFNKDYGLIDEWLDLTLSKICALKEQFMINTKCIDENILRDLFNLTNYRLQLERTNLNGRLIITKSNDSESSNLNEKLNGLNRKWKALIDLLNELKEKYKSKNEEVIDESNEEQSDFVIFNSKLNELNTWLDNGFSLLKKHVSPVDELENEKLIFELREFEKDLPYKQTSFESFFDKVKTKSPDAEAKLASLHFNEANERIVKFNKDLTAKRNNLENNVEQLRGFQEELNAMNNWITNLNLELIRHSNSSSSASASPSPPPHTQTQPKSSTPSPAVSTSNLFDSNSVKVALNTKLSHYNDLKSIYDTLNQKSDGKMPDNIKSKMDNLVTQWSQLEKESHTVIQQSHTVIQSSNKDIETISNDLFDWLLWIDHTLQSHVVTVGDLDEIQQAIQKYNSILDEVSKKEFELKRLAQLINQLMTKPQELTSGDTSAQMYEKFKQLDTQWKESTRKVNDRKLTLETMLNECRKLEQINFEFTNRILEMEEKVNNLAPIANGLETLKEQRNEYKMIKSEINQLKQLFDELKDINQTIIDKYLLDDTSKIRIRYERLVQRFNELSLILLNRGTGITEALQTIEDYDGTLYIFSQWLYKIEQDLNYLEDYCIKTDDNNEASKQTVIDLYKELQKEIDNHNNTYTNINNTSHKIIDSYKRQNDKENVQRRIEDINRRWILLRRKSLEIRSRLESNSSQWYALINSLNELIVWCKNQQYQIKNKKQSLQIDQNFIQKQINEYKIFQCNVEYKKSLIESTINSAKLYYDDKKKHGKGILDDSHDDDMNIVEDDNDELRIDEDLKQLQNIKNENDQAEYIIKKIQKKVKILQLIWIDLNKNTTEFNNYLINLNNNLYEINKYLDSLNQMINDTERDINDINEETQQSLKDNTMTSSRLIENLNKLKTMQSSLEKCKLIDDIRVKYQQFKLQIGTLTNTNTDLDMKYTNVVVKRWSNLSTLVNESHTKLCNVIDAYNQFGGDIYVQLSNSVQAPWQRAISPANKIPYYINHSTEKTSWDHPKMIELYKSFHNLNDIRFSAYRTAMKLRTLQKRLWLDLVDIHDVLETFETHSMTSNNERSIDINQMIQCLHTLYQPACKAHPQILNLTHSIDLTLNWLLSVYDPSRCGQVRVMSMKVALVLLCKGLIEDKYKYIYSLIADEDNLVTQRKLGLLLYEMIMIPKQLGEVAAFGGSNIEPSVRSCFEYAKNINSINLKQFLDWLKLEPQSIVWLPVLHRLAAAETARHEAKCSICKEYPIVGFRYRSLKHFNFDICQSCFFSGRKIKGFKFDHPLLEYYTPTSSSDDIKDFFRIFRNKFRSKRGRNSGKLGYLPVQTVLEGDDFETPAAQSPTHETSEPLRKKPEQQNGTPVKSPVNTNEDKLNVTTTNSQLADSDDEHILIAQYCHVLNSHTHSNDSPMRMPNSISFQSVTKSQPQQVQLQQNDISIEQQIELENQIVDLEEENKYLLEEYNRLRTQLNSTSTNVTPISQKYYTNSSHYMHQSTTLRDSTNYLQHSGSRRSTSKERNIIEEAKLLRQHENRLEARMKILENHNRLLDAQLKQLRQLLNSSKESVSKYSTVSATSLNSSARLHDSRRSIDRSGNNSNIGTLLHNVDDITRAINNLNDLVNIMHNNDK